MPAAIYPSGPPALSYREGLAGPATSVAVSLLGNAIVCQMASATDGPIIRVVYNRLTEYDMLAIQAQIAAGGLASIPGITYPCVFGPKSQQRFTPVIGADYPMEGGMPESCRYWRAELMLVIVEG